MRVACMMGSLHSVAHTTCKGINESATVTQPCLCCTRLANMFLFGQSWALASSPSYATVRESRVLEAQPASRKGSRGGMLQVGIPQTVSSGDEQSSGLRKTQTMWLYLLTLFSSHLQGSTCSILGAEGHLKGRHCSTYMLWSVTEAVTQLATWRPVDWADVCHQIVVVPSRASSRKAQAGRGLTQQGGYFCW